MTKTKSNFCLLSLIILLFAQLSFGQTTNQTTTNDTAAYQTAELPFPQSAIDYMATREMRYHHYMWHQVRENWNLFSAETQAAFTAIGWAPPNPARNYDPVTGEASAVLDNYSGEDFLYMHRTMIATINEFLAENEPSYGNVQGWTTLPAPGDPDYPVPPYYSIPNDTSTQEYVDSVKTDSFWTTIAYQEQMYKDPVQLRNMSLAVLGAKIDVTIHSYLHMRFSAESPLGYRDSYRGTIPYIDHQWDNSTYNWMGDTYASHVNPLFWKVHGWIDNRIQDWMNANNLSAITWHSQWTGGPMSNLSAEIDAKETMLRVSSVDATTTSDDSDALGNVLQQAAQILFDSGVPDASPADKVSLP